MQTYTIFFYETKPIFEIKNTLKQMAINYQDNFISKLIFGNKADIKHATFYKIFYSTTTIKNRKNRYIISDQILLGTYNKKAIFAPLNYVYLQKLFLMKTNILYLFLISVAFISCKTVADIFFFQVLENNYVQGIAIVSLLNFVS